MRVVLLTLTVITVLGACAAPMSPPTATPPQRSADRASIAPSESSQGVLWFELTLAPEAGGYEHGSLAFVEAIGVQPAEHVRHGEFMTLPAGSHELSAHARPCTNTCGELSAPVDECESKVGIVAGSEMTATILSSPGSPCRIGIRDGEPADIVGTLHLSRFDGAAMPYPVDGRCVLIDQSWVPVLPEGWSFESEDGEPLRLLDPDGRVVASEGELVWLVGDETDEEKPFGCDLGRRFEVGAVLEVDPFTPSR